VAQSDDWRTIEIETSEVTAPDVTVSPDGEWIIFTMLGHLFRLPVEGGDAEQLTFGPFYDTRPAVSPGGTQVAFQSDRDGSEGNIFLLDLASGEITQLTHESWADAPSWAPDGQSVVYLQLVREAWNVSDVGPNRNPRRPPPPALVRRVRTNGSETETLRAEVGEVRSPFHLPDGRVGWAVVERDTTSPRATTRIDIMDADGGVSTLHTLDGVADAIVGSDEELFVRRYIPVEMRNEEAQQREVVRIAFAETQESPILPISDVFYYNFRGEPRLALSVDDRALYIGNLGRLWKVRPDEGEMEAIPFRATVRMEVRDPVPPPRWTPHALGTVAAPRGISYPRLSPDGARLLFKAAHYLWEQPLDGGRVRRLSDTAILTEPVISPDGRSVAYVSNDDVEIRLLELESGLTRTVVVNTSDFDAELFWSHDGQRLFVVDHSGSGEETHRILAVNVKSGATTMIADRQPTGRTLIPADGPLRAEGPLVYFVGRDTPTLFSLSLNDPAEPEPIMETTDFNPVRVSADGKWLALTRGKRAGIWLAPLDKGGIEASDVQLLSSDLVRDFSFTPDGSAIYYAGPGNRVRRQSIEGGEPEEIPIRLELERPTPSPVLLRSVRVLDYAQGGFSAETSMLLERGRIRWIGSDEGRSIPVGTVTVEAGGRFAIPGLFDMHGHLGGCQDPGRVARGVTSARNMGGRVEWASQDADRSAFTNDPIPRCFYSGYILEGEQGKTRPGYFIHIKDEADARAQVRLMHEWGASFIKHNPSLPWPLHRAAADEARQLGLPVAAHGITPEEVIKGVTLGYRLTHTPWYMYDDLLQLLAEVGMRSDPTLGVALGRLVLRRREPERFPGPQPIYPLSDDALLGAWARLLVPMQRAYELGITLLPGTDWGPGGWALQLELEFFAEAGIPPIDILRFATQASAETVGAGDELGTLEVGKLADIVLLDANPLEDIKNTQAIWRVIKGGVVFDPETLRHERN
jgi:imidazolonepropionase-like amidohydrolase/Tol biopolymer transport system component